MEKWIDAWAVFDPAGNLDFDTISEEKVYSWGCMSVDSRPESWQTFINRGYTCRPIQIREKE